MRWSASCSAAATELASVGSSTWPKELLTMKPSPSSQSAVAAATVSGAVPAGPGRSSTQNSSPPSR